MLRVYMQRRCSRHVLSSEDACWVDTEQHVETGRPGVHQHQEKCSPAGLRAAGGVFTFETFKLSVIFIIVKIDVRK